MTSSVSTSAFSSETWQQTACLQLLSAAEGILH